MKKNVSIDSGQRMNRNDILVSVCCIAYNHEKYIRRTLEGFVNQKTSFAFEVLVHDDASTDSTAQIIREFEQKYPDIIKPIYQTENQYTRKVKIVSTFIYPRARGKYIAYCEGDDFWTDVHKLQMQVAALEENEGCSACFSQVAFADREGRETGFLLPSPNRIGEGVLKRKEYLSYVVYPGAFRCLAFQLSGCMVRKAFIDEYQDENPAFRSAFDVGDIPLFLYMGMKGDVYYIERAMSCYRTGNPESWVGRLHQSVDKENKHYETECQGFMAFDKYSGDIVHEDIERGIKNRKFLSYRLKHDFYKLKSPEMAELYSLLPKRTRMKEYIFYYMPWGEGIWEFLKEKIGIRDWLANKFMRDIGR